MTTRLPTERILTAEPSYPTEILGSSRDGLPVEGFRVGRGPLHVSLIAGCHADEPVGPAMLDRLAGYLSSIEPFDPLLREISWYLVPHVNPDGDRRNAGWSEVTEDAEDHLGQPDLGYELWHYARKAAREAPGDDIEFGFPRDRDDEEARPENRAVASFLEPGAPFHVHGSLHGMAWAPGPWFLIEPKWIDRTLRLRDNLRRRVAEMGYDLLDWDRRGDKGFRGIDEGFSTRPDAGAMRRHFFDRGDEATADLFRPSSMEYVRSLGGDPFTFVSEMPLFLHPDPSILAEGRQAFRAWIDELATLPSADLAAERAAEVGIRPMPIRDQMRLQLAFIEEAIAAAVAARSG